ncbi:GAF domain-containing protein [Antarcticibacterium arcticum]|uniref:histidine kinase n=1 Tax=Antarcticibacterium arcticum TaxID=2585771 RepID=A0A5B8YHR2_9FLAO|nr:ATP-binding protein [Antarcticibacterium arcticum]QED36568.1 GAF domain-containing protein [Antarcticibacterium arcticum]
MKEPLKGYPYKVDITNCDREPIHIIGSAQSHGVIFACDPQTFLITQCSENSASLLGHEAETLIGKPLEVLLPHDYINRIPAPLEKFTLPEIEIFNTVFLIIAHSSEKHLILEFEPVGEQIVPVKFQEQLSRILTELTTANSIAEITSRAANLVRSLFGYNRVMVYQFDDEWNGKVVAEEKEEHMESWLGLHYPATDIPKPSRDLFLKQEVRMISDVGYIPALIIPQISPLTHKPLDLSLCELRAVSTIHIEYLKNMKVGASLTAAIVLNGKLWGLLACHHNSPKFINYHQRQSVKFLTQIYTNALSVISTRDFLANSEKATLLKEKYLEELKLYNDLNEGLTQEKIPFTSLVNCTGGALYFNGSLHLQGITPAKEHVEQLVKEFLSQNTAGIFHTQNLEKIYPPASIYKDKASGVLCISIGETGEDLMIWFKQESSQEVSWGGNPDKNAIEKEGVLYLSPRKSFEKWTKRVSGIAIPWMKHEFNLAASLREAIIHIIVQQQREKIEQLNTNLRLVNEDLTAFGYSVSHDLRAPLRGISGYANILKERNYQLLDDLGKKGVDVILRSTAEMNALIEDLLNYAKLGQTEVSLSHVNLNELVVNILETLNTSEEYRNTNIKVDENLPACTGDRRLISQLFLNLVHNALKYSAEMPHPEVHIGYLREKQPVTYFIKDNGIGFDPLLEAKIYNVFSRLVGDEYPGTGVGLATVKKVIEKHNGDIWVETSPGKGSCFYFTLGNA